MKGEDIMKKKKKKGARSKPACSHGESPKSKFLCQCGKVLLITASYQIFSVGMDTAWMQSKCGKTSLSTAPPQITSFLTTPANAIEGQCALYTGCYDPCTGGCTGCTGCTGYTGPSQEDIRRQEQQRLEKERQRQHEIEEQRKKEEKEAKKRQEEFERKKRDALHLMKGITEGELGLKGLGDSDSGLKDMGSGDTGGLGIKDVTAPATAGRSKKPECEWGDLDSSVVDLRCLGLNPDKPITVDWHVVKGQERAFPAQIDPKTFENANYKRGFEALMHFDVASAVRAVRYFERARKERPNDPLVRNGLLLAQDILKARRQKQKDDQAKAAYLTMQSYAALMMGDNKKAENYISEARKLDPDNNNARFVESLAKTEPGGAGVYPARKNAYKLVANGLTAISKKNYADALAMLEAARRLQPEDRFIGMFLDEMHKAIK
jgi:tetratricopeptide (TPR) repeat protein